MERLCEDERMCIQKYVPDSMIGVSNERLYDEIKLLDPTFSMTRIYYQLVQWREATLSDQAKSIYPTYQVLTRYRVYYVCEHPGDCGMLVHDDDVEDLMEEMESLGYNTWISEDTIAISGCKDVIVSPILWDSLSREAATMEYHRLLHPIRNIEYRCNRMFHHSERGYNCYHDVHAGDPFVPDHRYDDDLYRAIRAIDPTIDMNILYDTYVRKHKRENAPWPFNPIVSVRDMYERWYPYLDRIHVISLREGGLQIVHKEGSDLDAILGELPGWVYRGQSEAYYTDSNVDAVYDAILVMLRIHFSYKVPHIDQLGVQYYDS
jgi:hypothetical protein